MREIVAREPAGASRGAAARATPIALFRDMGEHYKVEIIEGIPEDDRVALPPGRVRRPLPRPARARRPAGSTPSSSPASPARTGAATSATRCCSASTAPPWRRQKDLDAHLAAHRGGEAARPPPARRRARPLLAPPDGARRRRSSTRRARSSTTRSSTTSASLYARYGYSEVITPLIFKTRAVEALGALRELPRRHVPHASVDEREYGVKPMNCPGHCYFFATREALVSRAADPLRRLRPAAPLRARRARCAGLTRVRVVRAGRRAHLLHAGADRGRDRRVHRDGARGLRRLRLRPRRGASICDPAREVPRSTSCGTRPRRRSTAALRAPRLSRHDAAGRGRVLRPEDRVRLPRRARARAGSSPRSSSTAPCPSASTCTTSRRRARRRRR